jgi:tight adherence protein C
VLLEIVIDLFTFAFVATAAWAALRGVETMWDVRRRLAQGSAEPPSAKAGALLRPEGVNNPVLRWVQSSSSLSDTKDRAKLRHELSLAGIDHPTAPVWYVICRFGLAVGLPLLFLLSQQLFAKPMTGFGLIVGALALCGLGLVAPRLILNNRVTARRETLEHEFPDALDLMVVCVEAGLGLEAAFIRVGEEIAESHPRMSNEFNRVSDELRAGRGRADAWRSMADRTNVDAIKSFVALLIQTDSLGTSIGQTLRSYSVEMRQHRFLKAEEKAMRIPVLMTIPLVACILPVIITALLLPPIIDVMRTLAPALAGHHH